VPPSATPPDDSINSAGGFVFNAYGVRVPAVIVSPWIAPGTKVRPPQRDTGPPFDHASIIKTVRELFELGPRLTARDDVAPSILPALALATPANDGPQSLPAALDAADPDLVAARAAAPPNGMQQALAAAAALLPDAPPATDSAAPVAEELPDPTRYSTVALACAAATARVKTFLQF
jgi:phospholipase C